MSEKKITKNILREPLFHFSILGLLFYAVYGLWGSKDNNQNEENTLVVTTGEIAWLEDSWTKRWNRPPTSEEREGLINQHIEESVLYKEALKMGLDNDDVIIRRRLAQKLRFLQEDLVKPEPPPEKELMTYFDNNLQRYMPEELITITQVFLDPDKRGDHTLSDAESIKSRLAKTDFKTIKASDYGDRFMLQNYYPDRSEAELAKLFGSEFAKSVITLEANKWHGPILSGYGTHLVYIQLRKEAKAPAFEEVKELVLEDWKIDKQKELNKLFIESLLAHYEVIIEGESGAASPISSIDNTP